MPQAFGILMCAGALIQHVSLNPTPCIGSDRYTMTGADSATIWRAIAQDTAIFLVLGAAGPLTCIVLMEARARTKFLTSHGIDQRGVLHPFWLWVLRVQALMV